MRVRTGAGTGRDTLVLGKGDYTFEAGAFDDPKLVLVANGALDTRQPSSIVFNGPQRLGFLWVNNPIKVTPGGDNTLVLGGISIPYGLAIDLADNSLIVQPPPNRTGEYEWLLEYIQAARNSPNGKWKGWGITSSAAASTPNTTLAFMPNPGLTEFEEQAVRPEDFLIAYTYDGDANLDGRVNSDDYFRIDSGFLAQPASPGYRDGDFNYDGKINSDDYFLIDSAFLGQGAPATSGVAVAASPLLATPSAPARNQPPAHDRLDRRRKSVRRAGLFGTGRNILD